MTPPVVSYKLQPARKPALDPFEGVKPGAVSPALTIAEPVSTMAKPVVEAAQQPEDWPVTRSQSTGSVYLFPRSTSVTPGVPTLAGTPASPRGGTVKVPASRRARNTVYVGTTYPGRVMRGLGSGISSGASHCEGTKYPGRAMGGFGSGISSGASHWEDYKAAHSGAQADVAAYSAGSEFFPRTDFKFFKDFWPAPLLPQGLAPELLSPVSAPSPLGSRPGLWPQTPLSPSAAAAGSPLGLPHPSASSSFPPKEAMPPPPPPPPQRVESTDLPPALREAARYDVEAVRHERRVEELGASLQPTAPAARVTATLEAQIQELLESQENLRHELAQVKVQVGANAHGLEELQRGSHLGSQPPRMFSDDRSLPPLEGSPGSPSSQLLPHSRGSRDPLGHSYGHHDTQLLPPGGSPNDPSSGATVAVPVGVASPLSMYQPYYEHIPTPQSQSQPQPQPLEVVTQPMYPAAPQTMQPMPPAQKTSRDLDGPPQPPPNLYAGKSQELLETLHGHVMSAFQSLSSMRSAP